MFSLVKRYLASRVWLFFAAAAVRAFESPGLLLGATHCVLLVGVGRQVLGEDVTGGVGPLGPREGRGEVGGLEVHG